MPVVDPDSKRRRIILAGDVPSPIHPPAGCPFHPRCPVAEARCKTDVPALREMSQATGSHAIWCNPNLIPNPNPNLNPNLIIWMEVKIRLGAGKRDPKE